MNMDNWNIDTPEQVHLSFELAGIGSRFLALALDMLFQIVTAVLLLILAFGLEVSIDFAPSSWMAAAVIIALAGIFFVYFILFEGFTHGRTPGKMICGLRVIRDDGRPLDWSGTLARNLIRLIDFLPVFYGVGVVSMFLSGQSRRVGDIVAGTLVTCEPRGRSIKAPLASYNDTLAGGVPQATRQASRYPLREEELALVRDVLTRGPEMKQAVRLTLCWQVAQPLYEKFMIPHEYRQNCEDFLRMLWEENR